MKYDKTQPRRTTAHSVELTPADVKAAVVEWLRKGEERVRPDCPHHDKYWHREPIEIAYDAEISVDLSEERMLLSWSTQD